MTIGTKDSSKICATCRREGVVGGMKNNIHDLPENLTNAFKGCSVYGPYDASLVSSFKDSRGTKEEGVDLTAEVKECPKVDLPDVDQSSNFYKEEEAMSEEVKRMVFDASGPLTHWESDWLDKEDMGKPWSEIWTEESCSLKGVDLSSWGSFAGKVVAWPNLPKDPIKKLEIKEKTVWFVDGVCFDTKGGAEEYAKLEEIVGYASNVIGRDNAKAVVKAILERYTIEKRGRTIK